MASRYRGVEEVVQRVTRYELLCDECGVVIERADEHRLTLAWGVLDSWWEADPPLPDSPADLCGVACALAFIARVDALLTANENATPDRAAQVTEPGRPTDA